MNAYRSPSGPVYSNEPVLVLAQLAGSASHVDLTLSVTISISCYTNSTFPSLCYPAAHFLLPGYSLHLLPYPGAKEWYFALIPGLPAASVFIPNQPCNIIQTCSVNFTISSGVSYSVYLNGQVASTSSYQVNRGSAPVLPPIVSAVVNDSVTDPNTAHETYGLSPRGWVAGPNEPTQLILFSFGSSGIHSLSGYYSISGGPWIGLLESEDTIQSIIGGSVQSVNNLINQINSAISSISSTGYSFPNEVVPISVQDATIPAVSLRNYVTFKANSTDRNNHNGTSPEGFYYIANRSAPEKILVVDPHVELWLFLQNLRMYSNIVLSDTGYQLPAPLAANDLALLGVAQLLNNFEAGQFHYWHLLGENYNITISFPDSNIANVLQSFQPNVILLSDLSLGFQQSSTTSSSRQFFDWDLNDIGDSMGNTILSDVIAYTQQHHSGLIGTAGTLSDWQIWQCSQSPTKVQSRGHVGNAPSDADPLNEKTFAAMFGMPLLSIFEYLRDQAAQSLCNSAFPPAGAAIGSMPLLVSNVPWNGSLQTPTSFPFSLILNPNMNVMSGLPSKLSLMIPGYQQFGYNATNTIGWQLSLPVVLASAAWNAANQSSARAQVLEQNLTTLAQNVTGNGVSSSDWTSLDYALKTGINDVYGSVVHATINTTGIRLTLKIPGGGTLSKFVPVPIGQLAGLVPVQIGALSPDYAAGIVTYDKYYDSNGYRSVYFSFPAEASNQSSAMTLVSNAITWSLAWKYDITARFLGHLVVPGPTAQTFQNENSSFKGSIVASLSILANEQGGAATSFGAPSSGNFTMIILHPYSNFSLKLSSGSQMISSVDDGNSVTVVNLKITSSGQVNVNMTADPESSLNPIYIEVVQVPSSPKTITPPFGGVSILEIVALIAATAAVSAGVVFFLRRKG